MTTYPDAPGGAAGETDDQRITRNWNELLQELRVTQTGVQLLTGLLLTLPFSARFEELDTVQRVVYLCVLSGSVAATSLVLAPVAFHRLLFRKGERVWLVAAANVAARAGLLVLAVTICGVVWLAFDVVSGRTSAVIAGAVCAAFFAALWAVVPLAVRR